MCFGISVIFALVNVLPEFFFSLFGCHVFCLWVCFLKCFLCDLLKNTAVRESAVVFQLKGTMIVGIDTYHDSSAKGRSCGGVVATTNKDFTRYYSTVTFHMSHQELQDNLKVSLNGGFYAG